MAAQQRPLSPHLQVYRPQITTVMSIMHRGTGVVLAFGAFVLTAWLLASAGDNDSFTGFQVFLGSPVGKLLLLVFTVALVYHFLNGIRHLLWDAGRGFDIPSVYKTGYTVAVLTVVLTAAIWFLALGGH